MAVQCPNCGGYKVDEQMVASNPKSSQLSDIGIFALILLGGFGFSLGLFWPWEGGTLWRVLFILGPIFSIIIIRVSTSKWPRVLDCTCKLCGYKWTQKPGQPGPRIHVRPDLIQKGMQKLEEEEKERRRQEEAAYWLHQQMKK